MALRLNMPPATVLTINDTDLATMIEMLEDEAERANNGR